MESLIRLIGGPAPGIARPPSRGDPTPLRGRYRGCLLGLAAGNALGLPVEGIPRAALADLYPGGLRDVEIQERDAPWDDDLAQAVLLAECILEHDGFPAEPLAAQLVDWLRTNGRGCGSLTGRVIDEFATTRPGDAARVVWERDGRGPAGNGAVMRCAPVAMRWRSEPRRLIDETHASARITHHDPRCGWSAVAVNVALALALDGRRVPLEDLAAALDEAGAPPEVGQAVRATIGASLESLGLDFSRRMGYTLKAMQAGLWSLEQPGGFEATLIDVVNAGGDTDTNAAVAGAVLGARDGAAAIPRRWLENIRDVGVVDAFALRLLERATGAA